MIADLLREFLKFLLLYVVRPVGLLIVAIFSSFYNVLFAWWLDGLMFRKRQTRFEQEIQTDYYWLFQKYRARIVLQEPYRQAFDYLAPREPFPTSIATIN